MSTEILSRSSTHESHRIRRFAVASYSSGSSALLSPLVFARSLPVDGLDRMYGRMRALPYRNQLRSIIGFLLGTYESGTWLEERVTNAFTALEAMTAAITDDAPLVPDGEFRLLREELKEVIRRFGARHGLSAATRSSMYAKLGELQRRPITKRMAEVFESHEIEWRDIWPNAQSLTAALAEAYDRRSVLVHTGAVIDFDAAVDDYRRVHALTERLIYQLIGGEAKWRDPRAYRHLHQ